jgi:predicted O-methyltransferase YrrM
VLNLLKQVHFAKKILQVFFLRRKLLEFDYDFVIRDLGGGSKFDKKQIRRISDIVRRSCSSVLKSVFIAFMARLHRPKVILEMGTCLGTNALILAILNPKAQVVTIEGDEVLHRFARRLVNLFNQKNITLICANFDEVLHEILVSYRPDFIFVDGNHRREPTERYFRQICDTAKEKTVVFFDDIDWSEGMRQAWKKIWCSKVKKKMSLVKFGIISLNKMESYEKGHTD